MRIMDLANAIAPDLPYRITGIRPGEKLHEVMISEDDSRNTVDMGSYYVIEPAFCAWNRQPFDGEDVAEGFRYSSDVNDDWLSSEKLMEIANKL